jgi:2-polyprenyl-3-methyl-5-hydroxy-6-metoxy-1,4-benzoquinol methylase
MQSIPAAQLEKVYELVESTGRKDDITYFEVSRPRYERVLGHLADQSGEASAILDIGCAPGHMAMACSLAGHTVHAIDLNTEYDAKYLSQEWIEKLHRTVHDIEKEHLPYPDEKFDIVLFCDILEHIAIRHPVEILGEIKRVLRRNGKMILTTPNVANISNCLALYLGENVFWKPEIFYGSTDRHNREYTPKEAQELVEKANFRITATEYFDTHSHWNAQVYDKLPELMRLVASQQYYFPMPEAFLHSTILVCATPA